MFAGGRIIRVCAPEIIAYNRQAPHIQSIVTYHKGSDDPDYMKWLMMLIVPGSSLGGARPKASVIDPQGNLWIAKFPSVNDNKNIGAWEMIVNTLAENSGIQTAESQAQRFLGNNHTFLTKRFDRTSGGERIHFASAMTMLGYTDGVDFHQGVSYLEIVGFLERHGETSTLILKSYGGELYSMFVSPMSMTT